LRSRVSFRAGADFLIALFFRERILRPPFHWHQPHYNPSEKEYLSHDPLADGHRTPLPLVKGTEFLVANLPNQRDRLIKLIPHLLRSVGIRGN